MPVASNVNPQSNSKAEPGNNPRRHPTSQLPPRALLSSSAAYYRNPSQVAARAIPRQILSSLGRERRNEKAQDKQHVPTQENHSLQDLAVPKCKERTSTT
ncbi:hypothetical protein VTK56DRAFT_7090 [Thermocarpiscus australiensis]